MIALSILPKWPTDAAAAIALQRALAGQVRLEDNHGALQTVARIDCSYDIRANLSFAMVTFMRLDALQPLLARLYMEASITARPFFERHGFEVHCGTDGHNAGTGIH